MDDNSDDDLIQFSHNELELKNGEQVSNVTTTKTRSYTAAMEMRADKSNVSTSVRPKVQTYDPNMSQQVSYPPTFRYSLRHRPAPTLSANENQQFPRANSSVYHQQYSETSTSTAGAQIQSSSSASTSRHHQIENPMMTPGSEGQTHQRLNRRERRPTRKPPSFPEYADYSKRVSSFEFWPIQIKQTPEQMAGAGFFYTGSDDSVQCFQCSLKVRRWEEGDDVYAEHARIFPLCPYIREQRGDRFIAQTVNEDKEFSAKDQSLQYAQQEFLKYFERKRNRLLEMGFNDDEFKIVRQHFKNIGNFKPDIDEIVDALTETKTCELGTT